MWLFKRRRGGSSGLIGGSTGSVRRNDRRNLVGELIGLAAVAVGIWAGRPAWNQWRLMQQQSPLPMSPSEADLQRRREFIATYPPQLAIMHVEYVEDADWPEIRFTLVNEGGSKATIIDSKFTVWLRVRGDTPWPPTPPYEGEPITSKTEMERGAEQRLSYRDTASDLDLLVGDVSADNMNTVLLGYVRYVDDNGDAHILGFARIRADRTANFKPSDNPEYEYSR